jgi:hypothetical protein
MQEVSGAYPNDLIEVARLSSIDMVANHGPHSFFHKSFAPQIQLIARQAETPDGYLSAGCSRAAPGNGCGACAIEWQSAVAPDCGFANMMFDCSCVCHSPFQNEVIGG